MKHLRLIRTEPLYGGLVYTNQSLVILGTLTEVDLSTSLQIAGISSGCLYL
jgi:hypothetical protein